MEVLKFEVIDHTADVGIIAYGRDFGELLVNAALGMLSLMVDLSTVTPREKRHIVVCVPAPDQELLLLRWLKELHYIWEVEKFVPCQVTVSRWTQSEVEGFLEGEPFHSGISLLHHIKAVTHHLLRLEQQGNYLKVQIIFDV